MLTGAHVVANATFVQVQKLSDPTKLTARVVTSDDSDLALLRVEEKLLAKASGRRRSANCRACAMRWQVVGDPIGGEEVSITEGVVSRIEVQRYEHSQRHLLAVTVDAAGVFNEGNSGGPVFARGKVVGIAFRRPAGRREHRRDGATIIIRRFLDGVRTGKDPRVPGIGIVTQPLENPALRRHLGMRKGDSGVGRVAPAVQDPGSSAWDVLQPADVLMRLDRMRIADNGTGRAGPAAASAASSTWWSATTTSATRSRRGSCARANRCR